MMEEEQAWVHLFIDAINEMRKQPGRVFVISVRAHGASGVSRVSKQMCRLKRLEYALIPAHYDGQWLGDEDEPGNPPAVDIPVTPDLEEM